LTRIESGAFSLSSLDSIVIPRNVQFIDGSAFCGVRLSSISIESGNKIFAIENDFLIDIVHHKLIYNLSNSLKITIPSDMEILEPNCFSNCDFLSSISFESNSQLTRIKSDAFFSSSLTSILIPKNVQILGFGFLQDCYWLSSISFEYPS
jgi:hypothetical protein